mmetsp:Transcript_9177/g.24421  ORF Transcript_9177/g.24421 Transcript_9177/m.24421 type:complete len:201 (-) Transcript_9177:109-711(-)
MRQRVAEEVERLIVLSEAQVKQAHRREQLRVLRGEFERFDIDVDRGAVLLLQRIDLAQLHVRRVVPLDKVGALQALDRAVVLLEVHVAQPLVVPNLPVLRAQLERLLVDVERGLVPAEQVERAAHLLQVRYVVRVEARRGLEELQRLGDLAALALDQCLDVDRILGQAAALLEVALDRGEARVVVEPHILHVDEPVDLLS